MSLRIRQRILALTDTYDVCDHTGTPRYYISTEFLTIGHKIHICDMQGRELARIDERLFRLLHTATITIGGIPRGDIIREFTLFRRRYRIEFNGWSVRGDYFGWDYQILNSDGVIVATIERELFHLSDTYVLHVNDPRDELAALTVAITIDMMSCGDN